MKNLILGSICAVFASVGAMASEPESAAFTFDRAALADSGEAQRVYASLTRVVADVCRRENRRGAYLPRATRACMRDTLARTVRQIDAGQLTALYENDYGRRRGVRWARFAQR